LLFIRRILFALDKTLEEGVEGMRGKAFDVVEVPFYAANEESSEALYRPT
jgi:hypothetical protein